MARKRGTTRTKPNGRKSASEAKQTDKKDVKVKDDPGGGLPPAMEKSNSCSEGNTTSVSQQNPNLAAENSGPHHHHQPHHQHQQQHASSQSSAASSAISPDLKYLHKKFKRIASATLSTVDDSGSESKKHITSEALSRSTTINTTTATPTTIASATVDSGPVVAYPVAYLPNSKPTAVVNSAVEPSVQQQPCANNSNNEPKVGDIVNVYEATAARFRPIVEYSRTVIDRDRYQSPLQLIFPSGTDRVQQRPQLQQQSNGASLNCVNHVSGGSSTSSIISNNHISVKLEVSGDDTPKPYYPSVNNNSAINTSCDLNEKNQCSTTTVDVGNGGSSRSSSSGSALSAHELAIQADQKYVVVLQQPQPSPLYDGVSSSSVVAAPVETVSSPAVTTTGSSTVPGKYMCPYCRLNCNKPSVLEKHIRRHTNERPFRCDPCRMAFKTKSNLYKHCRSRAHRSKFPDKDIGPTVDEDGSLGSDIEDKELSNSGSDIINRGSPMMDDRVHSPQLLVEKPYKPKFHNAALYAKFDGNKLGTSGKTVPTTLVINSSQQHYISSLAGGGSNYSNNNTSMVSHSVPSTPHYLNGQNVESLEQHISKLISDNEAIVEVVELPLQKKYHKITGITRGISVNNSTSSSSSSSAGLDSPSSKLANALLQKRNSEELQQQQLLMLQQQHQMQQQQLQMQQQQQQVQPYPQNEPTKPKAMVAQIPYVQNHHPPVGTMEVMHQQPPQQQQPQMVARPMSANELQPQLVQYQLPLNLSKPVPSEPPPGPAVEVQVVPEPSRKRPPSESPRYSREQSPASSSSVQYQAPPSTSAVYAQQQVAPPSQPAPPASQTVPVNDHPQNPERSIIKDLLLNSREFGVVQNPENENIENLFTCKSCNTSFRDAEILKYHTICFCKGNSSSLNSPDSAPMSPIGSPSSHYMRSNRFNPNSLKNLARGLLMPPSRNPATLSKLAKSQLRQPRSRPENISLAPKEGSSSRSSSVTSTSTSHTPEVQVTPPVVAKIVDTVQNPLPSPGPLLGNTRLVDFQSSKSDTFSSKSAPEQNVIVSHVSSEDTPPRKRHIVTQDAEIRRPQHPSLQLYGGDLEVIERQEQMIPHRYSSGGTVTQYSPDADSEMNDSSMRARSSMHSGGTVVQVLKASRGASPIPMNPTTPKLVVTITPTLTPSLTTPNFFPNRQHQTPSERPNSNPNSSTVQSIGHFQFPPINSITAYNPLTLPQVSPGQASQIMHGGKMIPYVQGIPGPNSMIPSNESQMRGRPRLAPSPISIKTPPIPSMASNYKSFDPEDVVRNKKPVLAVPPVKNGMFKEIWSPAKQEINATPKKSFNFTRIADNISPRKKETIEPVKKEEIRYFNFENFISSDIIIKPNTPTESVKSEPVETKPMDVPPPPPVVQKPKFLRPNSLPLKPGTFTPKRHHGITPTHNTMPLISPETPRPSKSCRELYFNGHAYTNIGLKSSTKPFYCTVNKTQPFYVQTQKQLSMYSNWQVHPENDPHPLGFKPIQVMALYNSSQQGDHSYSIATKPLTLTVVNSSSANQPITSAIEVKSSFPSYSIPQVTSPAPKSGGFYPYLPEKSAASNDSIPPRSDSTERTLSGGFESTEEYTYVRGRGRGKYVCKECGIRCKKPSMLKKHIRTHTDVRPYSCQHCSFHFKTKGNLTKHMKSKSHFKKCTELGLNPIPTSVDDDGGDIDIENDQQSISSEQTSTIPFDSDSDPDSDGDDSDDSADYSEPKGGRLPEHEAAHMLLSLSMTPPTASQATKSYPSPVSFGSANQPVERGRLPYAPTVSPGLSMSPQQQPPIQPQPAQKHLLMQTQPESSSQPHRRIITFGNTPKMEFNLLKHEQYYSDPNINKKKREYNPSVEEDDGAMPIDLTKKPKESPPLHQAHYPMYHQYNDHQSPNTVPKQPLSDHPPSNLRSQVIVRVSDVVTPITGAANLLTTLVSNTDKIPLPLITNGSKELADDNVYFQEYIKQRALLDSKMKLSQMKSINNNQYEAQENHPPMEALVAQKKPPLTIAKPVPLKVTDKSYRIFNGKNEMLPKAVVEPANRIEILPIMNDPPQEPPAPIEAVRVDSTDACIEPVSTSRMETLAEVAAVSVKLDAGADSMRARSNSVISNEASNAQPSTSTPAAASSKESAKSVASEYLKLTKSVTMRKREDSESGTASDQETVVENSIIPPSIVPSIVPPVVVVPPVANPASAEHGGIVARTVIVGEDGFRKSASSEFSSLNPFQEDGGRPVCEVCHKKFHKISQLKIHMNIHYMERKFRCEPCGTSFRSQGLFQKHERSATHRNKVSMTTTFGIATDSNPRPFYCKDCEVGFRIHGHLAKHLRSKMHVLKLECLGKLPFGTYTEIERSGTNLTEIDTTDCENSLSSLKRLAVRLNVKISGNVIPGGGGSDAAPSGNETDSCDDNQYENDNESNGEGDNPNHRGTEEEEDDNDDCETNDQQGNNNCLKRRLDSESGGALNSDGDSDLKRPRFQGPSVEQQHGSLVVPAGPAAEGT